MRFVLRALNLLSNASRSCAIRKRRTGAAWLRIAFGSLTVILYALHLNQRAFLWGPDAVVSWQDQATMQAQSRGWTLYQFFPSAAGAECLYWAGLIVSLMFTLGLFTRVSSILFFVFTWSLYQRNWYAIDGGENLLIILAFYLMFADLSALSLDEAIFPHRRARASHWLPGMLHNFALVACLLQLSILYFESGFYKIQGHVWANGTALYYILRTNEFSLPGWSDLIWRSAALVTVGTYSTILFEVMHPFLLWHPKLKYVFFTGAFCLHTGIGILMGIPWFSITMISAHALLFDDAEYAAAMQFVRERLRFPGNRLRQAPQDVWSAQGAD